MASYVKLQSLKKVDSTGAQEIQDAVDAGGFQTAAVVLYASEYNGGGYAVVDIETAADNSEKKYIKPSSSAYIQVDGTGAKFLQLDGFARYLRWNVTTAPGTDMTFEIDLVLKVSA